MFNTSSRSTSLNRVSLVDNGAKILYSHQGLGLHWKKFLPPMKMGAGTGTKSYLRAGMGNGNEVNFHPFPPSLCERFSSPFLLFRHWLEKNLHSYFCFLDFSWIILCNLCIIKLILYELVKL